MMGVQTCADTLEIICNLPRNGETLPQDLPIPISSIYWNDTPPCHNDTCSTVFIAALYIIAIN